VPDAAVDAILFLDTKESAFLSGFERTVAKPIRL